MPKKSEISQETKKGHLESAIVNNLIELQKTHTNLIEKFDRLSKQLSDLLTLFEMAARSFAEHPANQVSEKDKDFLEKIDRLLEQNKTIARGLTLMEERIRERVYGQPTHTENEEKEEAPVIAKPLPKF